MTDTDERELGLALWSIVTAMLEDAAGLAADCQNSKTSSAHRHRQAQRLLQDIRDITLLAEAGIVLTAPRPRR